MSTSSLARALILIAVVETFASVSANDVVIEPSAVIGILEGNVTFSCSATDGPTNVTYEWLRSGNVLENETADTLTITNLSVADGAAYACTVNNNSATAVLYISPYITHHPMTIETTNGSIVSFTCEAEGFPAPLYRWEREENGVFTAIPDASDNVLEFKPVSYSDGGQYRCVAFLNISSDDPNRETESMTAVLTVSPQGGVSVAPKDELFDNDETITLTCSVLGGPGNSFQWLRKQQIISNEAQLTINVTSGENDGGEYKCIVRNSAGTGMDSTNVFFRPRITVNPSPNIIHAISGVTRDVVMCDADAYPSPSFEWVLVDGEVMANELNNFLVFLPVVFGNEGQYFCTATSNSITVSSSIIALIVSPENGVAVIPHAVVSTLGTSAMFNCTALGGPNNTMMWLRNGMEIENEKTNMLKVDVDSDIAGALYTCYVSNAAGSGMATAALYIQPTLRVHPTDVEAEDGSIVSFVCEAVGFPSPLYRWEREEENGAFIVVPDANESILWFSPVSFSDFGRYRCVPFLNLTGFDQMELETVSIPAVLTVSPKRGVTVAPQDALFNSSESVTLSCSTLGGPGNSFQWVREGTVVSSGSLYMLTIRSGEEDGGEYMCVVRNLAGNETVITNVLVRPEITLNPLEIITATVRDTRMLTCGADAFPPPQYQWVHIDGDIGPNVVGESSTTLQFNPVSFGDEGEYFCEATSNDITVRSSSSLLIVSPENGVSIDPPEFIAVLTGQPVSTTFNCLALGGPDNSFSWLRNELLINSETSNQLIVVADSVTDGAIYTCVASNAAGNDSATAALYIHPIITHHPMNIETTNGSTVSFTCGAEGFPAPLYRWEREENGVFTAIPGASGNVLEFNPVSYSDGGQYRCVAFLDISSDDPNRETESMTAVLTVSPANSVGIERTEVISEINEPITLICFAQGGPNNLFAWFKNDELIANGASDILISGTSAMNGGTYTCFVSNAAGNDSATAVLYISPYITHHPMTIETTNGSMVSFTCGAEGFPAPLYRWEREESSVYSTVLANGSILEFSPVSYSDVGQYRCVAYLNITSFTALDHETESMSAVLVVSPLGSVRLAPAVVLLGEGEDVAFGCSAEGGPGNTISWLKNGVVIENETANTLEILNVTIDDGAMYTCMVSNDAGSGSATASIYIRPSITLHPVSLETVNGSTTGFTCEAKGFPPPLYRWVRAGENGAFTSVPASGPALAFSPVLFGDRGSYYCVAYLDVTGFDQADLEAESMTAVLTVSPEGGVTVSPLDELFSRSDSVTLNCSTLGGPGNSFQWVREGNVISNESLYTLNIASGEKDGGDYQCVVSNLAGNETVSTTVFVRPQITLNPSDTVTAIAGDTRMLTCGADAFPPPQYQWVHIDGDIGPNVVGESTSVLMLSPLLFGDEGQYICQATSNRITVNTSISTVTISPQDGVVILPKDELFSHSEIVTLNCSTLGGPGNSFQWVREGNIISNESLYTLSITSGEKDGGDYQCVVSNLAGNEAVSTTVFVRPQITLNPSDTVTAIAGDTRMLTCGADAFPPPQYQWVHIDGDIGPNVTGESTNVLMFSPVLFGDEGQYVCQAMSGNITVLSSTSALTVSPLNSITVSPTILIGSRGDNVTYSCSALGGPANEFKWMKNELEIENETSSILRVTTISATDGAMYTCIVSNAAGSDSVTALLYVHPYITLYPVDIETTNASAVNFTCEADGSPPPLYRWEREIESTTESDFTVVSGVEDTTLEFNPVMYSDMGRYRCLAFLNISGFNPSDFQTESAPVVLTVSPAGSVRVDPVETFLRVGEQVTFNCSAQGGPSNTFSWFKNDIELENVTVNMLTIVVTSALDGAAYTCTASNAAGNDSAIASLYVRPYITRHPMNIETTNDSTVSFTCEAEGFPAPLYRWEREESGVYSTVSMGGNVLEFTPVVFGDEGQYRCRAVTVNPSDEAVSNAATMSVSPEDTISVSPSVILSNRSEVVEFNCTALGGPNNIFMWERAYDGLIIGNTSVLTIVVVSSNDGSIYQCHVQNDAGTESENVTLYVSPAIVIPPAPTNITIMEEPIHLMCTAAGYPIPIVTWTHNGSDVVADVRVNITSEYSIRSVLSTLTVAASYVNFSDSGQYECFANSTIQDFLVSSSGPVTVLVQFVPEQPQNVSGVAVNSTAIRLTWTEPHHNNAPLIGYTIRYQRPAFEGGDEVVTTSPPNREMAVILDLHPGITYVFTIEAFNEIGTGNPSQDAAVRTLDEFPSSSPQGVSVVPINSTSLLVSWEPVPEQDRNGFIAAYEVSFEPLQTFNGEIGPGIVSVLSGSALDVILLDLQENVEYNVSVRAFTSAGGGPFSVVVANRTLEDVSSSPPSNVSVVSESATAIRVTWKQVPAIDQNGEITEYRVAYEPLETFGGQIVAQNTTTNASTFEILLEKLQEFVEYNITVQAYTAVGAGELSVPISAITFEAAPVAPPQNLTVENTSATSLLLQWERPDDIGINGVLRKYVITFTPDRPMDENFTVICVPGGNYSLELTDLFNFTRYSVMVHAETIGVGPPASASGTTSENVPGRAPENVTASNVSSTTAFLEWDPPPEEEFPFGIRRKYIIRLEPTFLALTTIPSTVVFLSIPYANTSVLLTGLQQYSNYSIQVAAFSVGPGVYSDPIYIVTEEDIPPAPPTPPSPPEANITADSAILSWARPSDPNGEITEYTINIQIILTDVLAREDQMNATNVTIRNECVQRDVERNVTVPGNQTLAKVYNLTPDSLYLFRVQAATFVGSGDFSFPANFTTLQGAPSEPQNLTIVVLSSTSLQVSWMPPLCDYGIRTQYTIQHAPLPGPYEPLGSFGAVPTPLILSPNSSNLTLTGLTPYTNYSVSVYASTIGGNGSLTMKITQTEEEAPEAVTGLIAHTLRNLSNLNEVLVQLTWASPSPRNGPYELLLNYSAQQSPPYPPQRALGDRDCVILEQSISNYTIHAALPFAEYCFIIYARNIKLKLAGVSDNATVRSASIEPSAVVNLTESSVLPRALTLFWSLPHFPNGKLENYTVEYRPEPGSYGAIGSPASPHAIVSDNESLHLDVAQLTPSTNYTFTVFATNDASMGTAAVIEVETSIADLIPPGVVITEEGITAVGQTYTLLCTVTAVENLAIQPDIEWLDSGNSVLMNGSSITVTSVIRQGRTSTLALIFSSLQVNHKGQYTCRATINITENNIVSNSSLDVVVQIPEPTSVEITDQGSSEGGEQYTLTCSVMVDENLVFIPTVDWSLPDGSTITENDDFTLSEGSTITENDDFTLSEGSTITENNDFTLSETETRGTITYRTLTFNSLRTSLGGTYRCTGTVSVETLSAENSTTFTVIVKIPPPNVTLRFGRSGVLYAGTVSSLICDVIVDSSVDTVATVMVDWMGPDGHVSDRGRLSFTDSTRTDIDSNSSLVISHQHQSNLTFNPLAVTDTGNYSCSAVVQSVPFSAKSFPGRGNVIKTIEDLPAPNVTTSGNGSLAVGGTYRLSCIVDVVDYLFALPHTEWIQTNARVRKSETTTHLDLLLSPLTPSDIGHYFCRATVDIPLVGVIVSTASTVEEVALLDVPAPSVITSSSGDLVAGGEYLLTCSVQIADYVSISSLTTEWIHLGVAVRNSEGSTNLTLTLDPLSTSDNGEYFCRATINIPLVGIVASSISVIEDIVVQIPKPTLLISSLHIPYDGTVFVLVCTIEVSPWVDTSISVETVWVKGGLPLTAESSGCLSISNTTSTSNLYESSLTFIPLRNDSDTGQYSCDVSITPRNHLNFIIGSSASTDYQLTIQDIPAPKMSYSTSDGPVMAEQPYTLTCFAAVVNNIYGDNPIVQWMDSTHNVILISMADYSVGDLIVTDNVASLELTFRRFEKEHVGNYTCQGCINVPKASVTDNCASVTVETALDGPCPSAVLNLTVSVESNVTITWKDPLQPMGTITGYEVDLKQYIKGERDGEVLMQSLEGFSKIIHDTRLNVGPLEEAVPYEVTVVASNIVCYGQPTTTGPFFTQEGIPESVQNVTVVRTSDTTMTVSWNRLSLVEAKGRVSSYTVEYAPVDAQSRRRQIQQVLVSSEQSSVLIDGLNADRAYMVSVFATTSAGDSNRTIETVPPSPKPSESSKPPESPGPTMPPESPGLTMPQLIAIITVAVVVAATIAVIIPVITVCVTCRRYKKPTLDCRSEVYAQDLEPEEFGRSTPKTPDNTYEAIPMEFLRTPTLQQRSHTVSKPQDTDYDDIVQKKSATPPPLPANYETVNTHSPPAKPLPYRPPVAVEENGPPAVPPRNEKSRKPDVDATYASLTRRTKPQDLEYNTIPADIAADADQQEERVTSPPPPLPLKTEEYYESLDACAPTVASPAPSSSKLQYVGSAATPAAPSLTAGLSTAAATEQHSTQTDSPQEYESIDLGATIVANPFTSDRRDSEYDVIPADAGVTVATTQGQDTPAKSEFYIYMASGAAPQNTSPKAPDSGYVDVGHSAAGVSTECDPEQSTSPQEAVDIVNQLMQ